MRIGHGYDVHALAEHRDLIIGGVKIPHELGLLGHSDADVLAHAISDALLGAAALGDIGEMCIRDRLWGCFSACAAGAFCFLFFALQWGGCDRAG